MKKNSFRIRLLFVLLLVLLLACSQSFAAVTTFLDVQQKDWFYKEVNLLTEKGILNGYPDGTFKPSDTVTFGQFISIASRLVAEDKILPVEPGAHWASGSYKAAVSKGIISSSDFSADAKSLNAKISREDMAYILVNIAKANGENLSMLTGIEDTISDFTAIANNRRTAVLQAYSNGLLTGSGGKFKPKDYLKRSEVAAVFCRVMDYIPRPVIEYVPDSASGSVLGEAASHEAERVLELINIERAKAGVNPLIMCPKLVEVAKTKAEEQADIGTLSHDSENYGRVGEMLCVFGVDWSYCGENLASGQKTPEIVVRDWMNSPSHRSNILSENFVLTGVALAKNAKGKIFWVQLFSRP